MTRLPPAHNDGSTSTLLNLEGTIPIFYRGNQYNIPVEFWLVEAYPLAPPVCFVRPTSGASVCLCGDSSIQRERESWTSV